MKGGTMAPHENYYLFCVLALLAPLSTIGSSGAT